MKKFQNQKGLSLIEVTIMLLVLMLLTGVLAPSIMDFVNDAKWVKVKEDCEAISLSIARLTRDVGCVVGAAGGTLASQTSNCLHTTGNLAHIPAVLRTAGTTAIDDVSSVAGFVQLGTYQIATDMKWDSAVIDTLEDQLVTNAPNYVYPPNGFAPTVGPHFNTGWRGAYLGAPVGPDPWGSPYLVNSAFLNVAQSTSAQEGRHNYDTFCISAGPNRKFETKFQQPNAASAGDDFITIISGGTY